MIYYNESGHMIPAESIDLTKGYLVDKTIIHHEAETHTERRELPGVTMIYTVVDKPAWDEMTEQTYILYADHPSEQDKLEAQVAYTALMTDTVLEV